MKIEHITDNAAAVAFLRTCHADWIDGMPATTATPPDKSNIAQNGHYDPDRQRGVLAMFFGSGYSEGDSGWRIFIANDATKEEFFNAALVFSMNSAIRVGMHPSECLR
jgi:hypothetical protein